MSLETLNVGGMEKVGTDLALGLARRGFVLEVASLYAAGALADRLNGAGIRVHGPLSQNRGDWRGVVRLRRILRNGRFDFVIAIHGASMNTALLTALCCRMTGATCQRWVHATPGVPLSRAAWLAHSLLNFLRVPAVALTDTHARALHRHWFVPPSRIDVIWNGVPAPAECPAKERESIRREVGLGGDCFVVGIVAGFRPIKRHDLLVDAARRVVPAIPEARFLCVGDGDERAAVTRHAAQLGLSDKFVFTGVRSDVHRLMATMDVHVLCSDSETFPLSLAEAMCAGVASVATTVGGVPELATHERTALLIPPGSAVLLAEAILRLHGDSALRRRLGETGRQHARVHFSEDAMVDRFAALIRSRAPRRAARRPGVDRHRE